MELMKRARKWSGLGGSDNPEDSEDQERRSGESQMSKLANAENRESHKERIIIMYNKNPKGGKKELGNAGQARDHG